MTFKTCAILATYNHHRALQKTIEAIQKEGLKIFIIDDGSTPKVRYILQKIADKNKGVTLKRLEKNGGKGAAVEAGLRLAHEHEFTHAFQVDTDGQHDLSTLKNVLNISQKNPSALLSGHPIYDKSVPLGRRLGRWCTHIWVWLETLSFRITDTMCGFRIYPVAQTLKILDQEKVGKRMDFDVEIMVRLFWRSIPIIMSPVRVTYPQENHSNFDVLRDNWRLTKMHTRLVVGLLFRLPKFLFNKPDYGKLDLSNEAIHWAAVQERGSFLGIIFLAKLYHFLGRSVCLVLGLPVVFFFYITGTLQRRASHDFLRRTLNKQIGFQESFRHFMSFFIMALDKFAAWTGRMDLSQLEKGGVEKFAKMMAEETGGIIFVSHLGNMEFCRAVSRADYKGRVHVLLHTKNSEKYNRILKALNPQSNVNIIEVTDIGADTMLYLKERLEQRDWLVIAADRVPLQNHSSSAKRVTYVPFLGKEAPFSQGPYILASLLDCPVYTAFALKKDGIYQLCVEKFSSKISLNRQTREEDIEKYAQKFARILEEKAMASPYQWFNFFDFWAQKK